MARIVCICCGTDVSQFRLDLALKMGATHTVLVDRADSGRDIARKVCDVMGAPAQYTIECSGVESSLQAAIYVRAVRKTPSAIHSILAPVRTRRMLRSNRVLAIARRRGRAEWWRQSLSIHRKSVYLSYTRQYGKSTSEASSVTATSTLLPVCLSGARSVSGTCE